MDGGDLFESSLETRQGTVRSSVGRGSAVPMSMKLASPSMDASSRFSGPIPNTIGAANRRHRTESAPHICFVCDLPIAIYGRLQPCSHALCLTCAEESKTKSECPRCHKAITAIDRCDDIDTVFVCGFSGCNRAYLTEFSLVEHQKLRKHAPDKESLLQPPQSAARTSSHSPVQSQVAVPLSLPLALASSRAAPLLPLPVPLPFVPVYGSAAMALPTQYPPNGYPLPYTTTAAQMAMMFPQFQQQQRR